MAQFVKMCLLVVAAICCDERSCNGSGSRCGWWWSAVIDFSGAAGAGIVMLGAAFGIAKIGAAAVESMARQPEVAGDIRGAMIVAAALIEGATFFALIVCMIA